jgi:hypothetical protein
MPVGIVKLLYYLQVLSGTPFIDASKPVRATYSYSYVIESFETLLCVQGAATGIMSLRRRIS